VLGVLASTRELFNLAATALLYLSLRYSPLLFEPSLASLLREEDAPRLHLDTLEPWVGRHHCDGRSHGEALFRSYLHVLE
jgi:hypothetical protein